MAFSNFSLDEVKARIYDKPDNINFLRYFFGNKNTPPDLQAGQSLTPGNLEAYQELAQRIRQIKRYLSGEETPDATGSS